MEAEHCASTVTRHLWRGAAFLPGCFPLFVENAREKAFSIENHREKRGKPDLSPALTLERNVAYCVEQEVSWSHQLEPPTCPEECTSKLTHIFHKLRFSNLDV